MVPLNRREGGTFVAAYERLLNQLNEKIRLGTEPIISVLEVRATMRDEYLAQFNGGFVRDYAALERYGTYGFLVFDSEEDAFAFVLSV